MLDVTVSTYVPGERSKSPNPRVQSWHASSVSLPCRPLELVRDCRAAPRTPCPPLAGSMFAPSLQHPLAPNPAASPALSPAASPGSIPPGRAPAQRSEPAPGPQPACSSGQSRATRTQKCSLGSKCWPRLGGITGKQLFGVGNRRLIMKWLVLTGKQGWCWLQAVAPLQAPKSQLFSSFAPSPSECTIALCMVLFFPFFPHNFCNLEI